MKPFFYRLIASILFLLSACTGMAYTRQDTLRGSNGRGRDWWDVMKYELWAEIDTQSRSVSGSCTITFRIVRDPGDSMQIDLQQGMTLELCDTPNHHPPKNSHPLPREGNVYWYEVDKKLQWKKGDLRTITLFFQGKPHVAINPPWDGGFIWAKDSSGNPWTAVACQGLGASSWWPCKDYQGDKPDSGMLLRIYQPSSGDSSSHETIISNGRTTENTETKNFPSVDGTTEHFAGRHYQVKNPINTYNATFYIGKYTHWHDTLRGEKGVLDLDFYPLLYNEIKARKQWAVTKEMLRCYEYWLGPYPFYEDGYKLVEAPYLGMEHQSAIAYGNQYKMGYLGHDYTGTGLGMSFDYIVIHESGHEWFGNSITAQDIADNWIHEGFTTYLESLFVEWIKAKEAGFTFHTGSWRNILNDSPVIGDYGVRDEGSGDRYTKGAAVVYMIRRMMDNDSAFRQLLRGLNRDFYHKVVTSKEVEEYISRFMGKDLKPFFNTYLRSTRVPMLSWQLSKDRKEILFQWNALSGFDAPVSISTDGGKTYTLFTSIPPKIPSGKKKYKRRNILIRRVGLYNVQGK